MRLQKDNLAVMRQGRLTALALIAISLASAGCSEDVGELHELTSGTRHAIVNGDEWHWDDAARVGYQIGEGLFQTCTGTFVSPGWLVTAKHCLQEEGSNNELPIEDGYAYLDSEREIDIGFTDTILIDGRDVALVEIDTYVYTAAGTLPIHPASGELQGQQVREVGFGSAGTGPVVQRSALFEVDAASNSMIYFDENSRGQLCEPGDSGGPLFATREGRSHLGAVLSQGVGADDCRADSPAVDAITSRIDDYERYDQTHDAFAVFAWDSVRINDRAKVHWDEENAATACNSARIPCASVIGGNYVRIGSGAQVGGVVSETGPTISSFAQVWGNVISGSPPQVQQWGSIRGQTFTTSSSWPHKVAVGRPWVPIRDDYTPDSSKPIMLEPNQQLSLAPGRYGDVNIKRGATLTLGSPGVYVINSLTMDPDSTLQLADTSSPTRLHVHGGINGNGGKIIGQHPRNLLIAVSHGAQVNLDTQIVGATLAAPDSRVDAKQHQYANIYARHFELHQDRVLTASPEPLHPHHWFSEETGW